MSHKIQRKITCNIFHSVYRVNPHIQQSNRLNPKGFQPVNSSTQYSHLDSVRGKIDGARCFHFLPINPQSGLANGTAEAHLANFEGDPRGCELQRDWNEVEFVVRKLQFICTGLVGIALGKGLQ